MYTHIHMCTYTYIYVWYGLLQLCLRMCTCTCTCVCVWAWLPGCMSMLPVYTALACMVTRMRAYCARLHACTRACAYTHTHTHTHVHACVCVRAHTHARKRTVRDWRVPLSACRRVTSISADVHVHACMYVSLQRMWVRDSEAVCVCVRSLGRGILVIIDIQSAVT